MRWVKEEWNHLLKKVISNCFKHSFSAKQDDDVDVSEGLECKLKNK